MSCSDFYSPLLHSRGYRMTPQRLAILHVLHRSEKHLTPGQIYAGAKKELTSLTEPTVYRNLEFLAQNGLVNPTQKSHGHLAYELVRHAHDHLVCRNCGEELELDHSALQQFYRKIESLSGYRLTGDHVTFFGVCARCQKIFL